MNPELSFSDGQKTVVLARVAGLDAHPKDLDFIYEFGLEFIHVPPNITDKLKAKRGSDQIIQTCIKE